MKKFIFAWAIFLASTLSVLGQEAAPADTGAVVLQPADTTGTVAPEKPGIPGDTGSVASPLQEAIPADTGGAVAPPQQNIPADTAAAAPPPADTGAVPPQPADTETARLQEKTPPVDTTAFPPPQEKAPADTQAALSPEEEAPKAKPANRLAFGIVFNDEAPVSMRTWFNPKVGLDIGVGLRGRRVDDSSTISDSTPVPNTRVMLLDLSFDLGIPVRALRKEKVDLVLRPGFGVRTRPNFEVSPVDPTVRSIETTIELEMNGSVGFEYYPYEKVGFSLQAGLALILVRTGGDISNSVLRLQSLPSKKGVNFAFRYYLL